MDTLFNEAHIPRLMAKSFDWYTPAMYPDAARKVMGSIDLDPASCDEANRLVKASKYYDEAADGLTQPWYGNLWLNPPYCKSGSISNQETWTCKLIAEYEAGHVAQAVLLVNAATETRWFQRLYDYPVCFVKGRIRFISPTGTNTGPTVGSAFVYFGSNVQAFDAVFRQIGRVVYSYPSKQADLWSQEESA